MTARACLRSLRSSPWPVWPKRPSHGEVGACDTTVRVRTTSPRVRPVEPAAQTASKRRWAEARASPFGNARGRAASRVPSLSKTSHALPARSNRSPRCRSVGSGRASTAARKSARSASPASGVKLARKRLSAERLGNCSRLNQARKGSAQGASRSEKASRVASPRLASPQRKARKSMTSSYPKRLRAKRTRSPIAESTPCWRSGSTRRATSPHQEGVAGTDAAEVWMSTEEAARLVLSASFVKNVWSPSHGGTCSVRLRHTRRLVASFVGYASWLLRSAGLPSGLAPLLLLAQCSARPSSHGLC